MSLKVETLVLKLIKELQRFKINFPIIYLLYHVEATLPNKKKNIFVVFQRILRGPTISPGTTKINSVAMSSHTVYNLLHEHTQRSNLESFNN